MDIAILGAGSVGAALGRGWIAAGHVLTFGVRNPGDEKYRELNQNLGGAARFASIGEAAAGAETVVLATPWDAAESAIRAAGDLSGRIVIDATNPLKPGLAGLTHAGDDSGGEQVGRWAAGAKVVKAFNTVGFNIMADPLLDGRRAAMFVCGDDAGARAAVARLAVDLGFEAVEAGGLATARQLEPLALLWIRSAYQFGLGREFAFGLLRR